MATMTRFSWYFEDCSRSQSERLLMHPANDNGAFIIRPSESIPNAYSLSIRDGNQVKHYIIHGEHGVFWVTKRKVFRSLQQLVAYYSTYLDDLCSLLTRPCIPVSSPPTAESDHPGAPHEWTIPRSSLTLTHKLGEGLFGFVWEGLYNKRYPVAIKSLKPGKMDTKDFLFEASVMKTLYHRNLLKLYAVCTEKPVYIVTELMKNGSLLEFLRNKGREILKLPQLINFGAQIACGMAYLEAKNFIHRDLAARNVLLGDSFNIKIADFGLARYNPDEIYTAHAGTSFPIKWTAPEAATHNKFSIKSDVWSFGIVLVELVTYGAVPYPGLTPKQALAAVESGYRMPKPPGCPVALYEIMIECWHGQPLKRPTFDTLEWKLDDFFYLNQGPNYREASSVA